MKYEVQADTYRGFFFFLNPQTLRDYEQAEEKWPYRVIFQIIFVKKVSLVLRQKRAETVAEKIHLLLDKPPPEILPEIRFRLYCIYYDQVSLLPCIMSGILYHLHHPVCLH